MSDRSIFAPVAVLAIWTIAVLGFTAYRRIRATFQRRVRARDFSLGESENVPPDIAVANRNFMNLLELPVLFYVACIVLYVTRSADLAAVWVAWVYVTLRV